MPHVQDGPPIPLTRLILLPVGLFVGFVAGIAVGAVFFPYVVLNELVRKFGQSWSYLDGWAEWAEAGGKGTRRRGWMFVWVVWVVLYAISFGTWGPVFGMVSGPFIGAYIVLVPDGLDRFLDTAKGTIARFRRMQIRIVDPEQEKAA